MLIASLNAIGWNLWMWLSVVEGPAEAMKPRPTPVQRQHLPPNWKQLRRARRHDAMVYYWYWATACVIVLIAIRQLCRLKVRPSRLPCGAAALWTKIRVHPLKVPYLPPMTAVQLAVVFGYGISTTTLTVYASYFGGVLDYANPTAMLSVAQLPLIVGLVGRNHVVSTLTGVSYEQINYIHRTAGHVCFGGALLHTLGWLIRGLGKHAWTWRVYTAVPAMMGLATLALLSSRTMRSRHHQLFRDVHILAVILFMAMTWFHTPEYRSWVLVGLVIWSLDRAGGFVRIAYARLALRGPQVATVRCIDDDLVSISVPVTFKWRAGTHAYLCMPTVAAVPWEQHPFTFANVPGPQTVNDAMFIVRAHGGFTRRLVDALQSPVQKVPVYVEGPYGEPQIAQQMNSLLLVAGGTGVTPCLAYFMEAITCKGRFERLQAIRLVWNVRRIEHVMAVAPLRNETLQHVTDMRAHVHMDIHVTRTSASDEPTNNLDETAHLLQRSEGEVLASPYIPGTPDGVESRCLDEWETITSTGLGLPSRYYTTIHHGRSHTASVIRDEVNCIPLEGSLCVVVCGPPTLTLETSRAVSAAVGETTAHISYHACSFQL